MRYSQAQPTTRDVVVPDSKNRTVPMSSAFAVTLGLRDDQTERVEIASGVKEGDRLLVGPAQAITPGTPLQLQGAGEPAAPAAPVAPKS